MGFAPAHRLKLMLRPLAATAAAAWVGACANPVTGALSPPPFADSPVTAEAKQASAASGAYPKFSEIPATPLDVRPTRAWSNSIYDMLRLRRQMLVEAAMAPPPPSDTEAFAQSQRNKTDPAAAGAAPAAGAASFVEGGRERATPPSPAN